MAKPLVDFHKSDVFALGIVLLEVIFLRNFGSLYDVQGFKMDLSELENLCRLIPSQGYSTFL
jgi:hypothetical protein